MANELRVRQNFLGGLVRDDPLADTDTYFNSDSLPAMVAIGSTQHLPVILDPDGIYGEPEIVYVISHPALDEAAQISRGMEGTVAREHPLDTPWVHGPLKSDVDKQFVGCRLYQTAAQSLAHATYTALTWDTESYDPFLLHSLVTNTSRITFDRPGKWRINSVASFAFNTTGARVNRIRKDGTTTIAQLSLNNNPVTATSVPVSTLVNVTAAGEYVEIMGYQSSTAALDTNPGTEFCYVEAVFEGV